MTDYRLISGLFIDTIGAILFGLLLVSIVYLYGARRMGDPILKRKRLAVGLLCVFLSLAAITALAPYDTLHVPHVRW